MNTYIHKSLAETSEHFMNTCIINKIPPRFRTETSDFILFKHLEFNYIFLFEFCCHKRLLKMTPLHIKTTYTLGGYMSYENQEWTLEKIGKGITIKTQTFTKIQHKLEELLETSIQPSSDIYQTFHFELKGREKETHLLGMYYRDEKGKIVFYFFNCVNEVQLESERIKNFTYKKDEAFCEEILKTLIEIKEIGAYKGRSDFATSIGKKCDVITSTFNKTYNNTLLGQYKTQRLLYALELLLYTEYDCKQIQLACQYKYDKDFYRDFKENYFDLEETLDKITLYKKILMKNKGDLLHEIKHEF